MSDFRDVKKLDFFLLSSSKPRTLWYSGMRICGYLPYTGYSVSGRVIQHQSVVFAGGDEGLRGIEAGNQCGRGADGAVALADKLVSAL